MKRPAIPPITESSDESRAAVLAAIAGHELNNIAVPLECFTEAVSQIHAIREPADQAVLDEISIAIGRIKLLASELQSLGESSSLPVRELIGDCMSLAVGATASDAWKIDWRCSATVAVNVDRPHAQHAIQALARIAARVDSRPSALPDLIVSQELPSDAPCAACGATLARGQRTLRVQAYSSRAVDRAALRDPFTSASAGRAGRRLTLAVLAHCAHKAGGHVLLDDSGNALSVAFPIA
jgi:hypothetical protein